MNVAVQAAPSTTPISDHPIEVKDAGIVILNAYFPTLFKKLGLQKDNQFISPAQQTEAVQYLEELATGTTTKDDSLLSLNKVLCGLSVTTSASTDFTPTSDQRTVIEGLISAAIAHWPSIGSTTINGFRGNWLVRQGTLVEKSDSWELTVERRSYDVLLDRSPYSFSTIKYPWMTKPVHVIWK